MVLVGHHFRDQRIEYPSVHMHQIQLIQHLMIREAFVIRHAVQIVRRRRTVHRRTIQRTSLVPAVICDLLT